MTQFSAILIGNESLTQQCGAMLLARGHRLACVVTRNLDVRKWALALGLRVEAPGANLNGISADWLLSVANLAVIPDAVLALATKGAVNFHDGPLPRYAGLNAPVWAIMNGESHHGISWHLIEGGIDEGDILEQRLFDIAPNDTALTLNSRCFEAAIDSFPALLSQLETGVLSRKPQDLMQRSLFLRHDRPAAMGRLDFAAGADAVLRLVRALDHGRYWNPLCTAKIATSDRVLNVGAAERADGHGAPGTLLAADDAGLVVACGEGAVRLWKLTCQLKGLPVNPATVTGPILPQIDAGLTAALATIVPSESRLRAKLLALEPALITASAGQGAGWNSVPLSGDLDVLALAGVRALGLGPVDLALSRDGLAGYISDWTPVRVNATGPLELARKSLAIDTVGPGFALDLTTRDVALAGLQVPQLGLSLGGPVPGTVATLTPDALHYDAARITPLEAQKLADRIAHVAAEMMGLPPEADIARVSTLTKVERDLVLLGFNQTEASFVNTCVHSAFEAQVARTPNAIALVCERQSLTYAELNARANRVADVLIGMGVVPGTLVGLCVQRGLEMVIGALAIQKAGGAYVPMDPAYPIDRIALYIEDSACPVIVTQSKIAATLPSHSAQVLCLDTDGRPPQARDTNPNSGVTPADLAYMIYTSGSTGRPKGVMVEHRNVANFFAGMDERIGPDGGVWLAVTSLSFDISVLELFWTLARGFKVVLTSDDNRAVVAAGSISSAEKMEFSLYYWGNDDGVGPKKYELLLEGAKFADAHGFCAVWTPERHFHAFGGPYPNPSVTGAAVAAVTKNIGVRAGSCVVPLHHPARIAEDWAVIDNLTNGRAGMAVASGWHPDDFVLRPENTPPNNKKAMFAATEQIRRLWRGETVEFPTANGMLGVVTQPRPVSKELPIWVTTAGNPETWREAGVIGAHVLTHLLGQTIVEVAGKIKIYHQALRENGHDPARFTVTLMLHTFVGRHREQVRRTAEGPMKAYLGAATALVKQYAWAFPAFKKPPGITNPMDIDTRDLSAEDTEAILDFAFQRYFEDSGLFGTVEDALVRVEQLKRIGVTEVACLVDYGIAPEKVLEGLYPLAEVVKRANAGGAPEDEDFSIAAQMIRHQVTHLQCTPSMARMITMNDDSRMALAGIKTMMLGGEPLPSALVAELRAATPARLLNMYGPTETTIWSSTEEVGPDPKGTVSIGKPLANQHMYVLDERMDPVSVGVPGELWIGGLGVTRGYWQRPDLTTERFVNDPFVTHVSAASWGGRMYRTGDLVRWRADGRIDFLGRTDHQIKLRGYRIELGEIEAVLEKQPGVRQAVVLAREDMPGDVRLVAYVMGTAHEAGLRAEVAAVLPDHMVPAHFVRLEAFPLTPNRKVDRNALPAPAAKSMELKHFVATSTDIEGQIAAIWARVLGVSKVGAKDNFFALGGHSLLAVQAHREMKASLGAAKLSITDIFRFPTLEALAAHLDDRPKTMAPQSDRADARVDAMARRRAMRSGRLDA